MQLVIGRGNNRRVFIIPCGQLVKNATDKREVVALVDNLCELIGIPRGKEA